MKFWGISALNRRILKLKRRLNDDGWRQEIARECTARGIVRDEVLKQIDAVERPIKKELEELENERRFLLDERTAVVGIGTIAVALAVAFGVPVWQSVLAERAEIQALYQSVVANGDIAISNFNELRHAQNATKVLGLPESFIEFPVDERVSKKLQRELGIDLYRYFRVYLEETKLLNKQIEKLHNEAVLKGGISVDPTPEIKAYQASLTQLNEGTWETSKFNYFYDTACIQYLLTMAFPYLSIADRDRGVECSTDSLNRVFYHYGYIEAEMPLWLRSQLRSALNEREAGLGDYLINLTRGYEGPIQFGSVFRHVMPWN
jgi:hypothetical protein